MMSMPPLPPGVRPLGPADPRQIGAYTLLGHLGEGGMGTVYLGQARDGARVAIKVVRAELAGQPQFRERFRREARAAMSVPRFCTAEVLAADPDAPEPYLVTEYIEGQTLDQAVTGGGPLRRAELEQLGVALAGALAGIHSAGVTHRDLKPANVLLSRLGPRVIDFGIASAVDMMKLTADGQMLGTPTYMAPEQLQGNPVQATDVFAWGGVMVFAATGHRPFGTGSVPELAARIMGSEPDLRGIEGPLRNVVAAALIKDPRQRPPAAALLEMLGVQGGASRAGFDAAQTRMEHLGGTLLAPPFSESAGFPPPPPDAGSGPGVPPGGTDPLRDVGETWRSGVPPRLARRRRNARIRSAISTLLTVAVVAGVAAWWWTHRGGDARALAVTDVAVSVADTTQTCDSSGQVDVKVQGVVTTNGGSGTLVYQWQRSDEQQADTHTQQVSAGQQSIPLTLDWQISGTTYASRTFQATLSVVSPQQITKSAKFHYTCKHHAKA